MKNINHFYKFIICLLLIINNLGVFGKESPCVTIKNTEINKKIKNNNNLKLKYLVVSPKIGLVENDITGAGIVSIISKKSPMSLKLFNSDNLGATTNISFSDVNSLNFRIAKPNAAPIIRLDNSNNSGAGGINVNTKACSSGTTIFGVTASPSAQVNVTSPDGQTATIVIKLTNPQDGTNENLFIGGIFNDVTVSGSGTTIKTLTNNNPTSSAQIISALQSIKYKNTFINPNTSIQRQITVQTTDAVGQLSNIATAFVAVTRNAVAGKATVPLYVFTGGSSVDLLTGLDGTQDAGGTWIDADTMGALSGSTVNIAALPLGSSVFNYRVANTSPCSNVEESVVVFKISTDELGLTSPNSCGFKETLYSNATFSGGTDDLIFANDVKLKAIISISNILGIHCAVN